MALYLIVFAVILVFFPITVTVYTYYNKKQSKLYFAIYVFKHFLLVSGYFRARNAFSVYLHVKNKAYIIDINTIKNLTKGNGGGVFFTPLSLFVYVDSAVNLSALSFLMLLNTAFSIFNAYKEQELYYFETYYALNLVDNNKNQNIKISFTFTFNLFCILRQIIANYIIKGVKIGKIRQSKS